MLLCHPRLRQRLLVALLLVSCCGCSAGPTLEVVNETPFALFDVELQGDGFHEHIHTIAKGDSTRVEIHPPVASRLTVRFSVSGQPVEHTGVATVKPGTDASLTLHVQLDLSIRVTPAAD